MAKAKFNVGDRVRTKNTNAVPLGYQDAEGVVESFLGNSVYVKFPDGGVRLIAPSNLTRPKVPKKTKSLELRAKYGKK